MNNLLRFTDQRASVYYDQEIHLQKFSDKPFIIFIIMTSTMFYIIDIIISTYTYYFVEEKISPPEMMISLVLQTLKLIVFYLYYKFHSQKGKWNTFSEIIFGFVFVASIVSVWNSQIETQPAKILIIGLDAGWTLLFLHKVLTLWELKVGLSILLFLFGLIKTFHFRGETTLVFLQIGIQTMIISILIYLNERNHRMEFVKKFHLERREQALTTILNNIPYSIAILDMKGYLKHCNQYLDTCFNMSEGHAISQLFKKFYDIKPREKYIENTFVGVPRASKIFKTPNKTNITVSSLRHIPNQEPKSLSFQPSFIFRKKRRGTGKETPRRLSRLEEYYAKDTQKSAPGYTGLSLTELLGNVDQYRTLQEVIDFFTTNTDGLRSYIGKQNNFFIFDGKYKDFDDQVRSFEIKISIANFDSDECLILILRDTTHRDIIVTLEGNNSYKDSVLSSISHELKTPLNTNLNLLEMAIKDGAFPHELKDNFLLPAHQSGKLLQSLINDILDYSLILANKFSMKIKGKHLFYNIEKLRYLSEFQAKKKRIEFHISISQKLTYKVWTDHRRLRQILINLLNNAIKFTSKGHICLRIEPYENTENLIKFCVLDTGIGIDPLDLERMTDLLKRNVSGEKLTNKSAELGMGLLISSKLAKKLGPADEKITGLNVTSVLGEGTKFWFVVENRDKHLFSPAPIPISKRTSQVDSPRSKLHFSDMINNTGKAPSHYLNTRLNTQLNTQEEIRMTSLQRINTSMKMLRTQVDHPELTDPFTEILDKSALIDDELAEEKLACMIKDDNLKMSQNLTKMIKSQGFRKGFSKASTFTRVPTSVAGSQTPKKGQLKNSSPKSAVEFPQIVLNVNPAVSEDICLGEGDMICICSEVLIVDDDMFNLFTMQAIGKSLNLQMTQATNGKEAIEAVLRRAKNRCSIWCRNFKLILMDLSMPTMDGFEATIKLREMMAAQEIPPIPIVACTAFVDNAKHERCYEIGMEGTLLKPVAKGKFIETLKRFHIDLSLE